LDDHDDPCASAGARSAKTNAIIVARNVDERILKVFVTAMIEFASDL